MSHASIGGLRVIGIGVECGMRRMVTYHCVVSFKYWHCTKRPETGMWEHGAHLYNLQNLILRNKKLPYLKGSYYCY